MSPRRLTTCLALFFLSVQLYTLKAQTLNEDSLVNSFRTEKNDSIRIYGALKWVNYLLNHKLATEQGFRVLDSIKKLPAIQQYPTLQIQGYNIAGNFYKSNNNWPGALDAFNTAFTAAGNLKDNNQRNKVKMMLLSNIGSIYTVNGDFKTALEYRLQALELVEQHPPLNYTNLGTVYINLSTDYLSLKMPDKAIEYAQKVEQIFDSLKAPLQLTAYSQFYDIYSYTRNQDSIKKTISKLTTLLAATNLSVAQKLDGEYMAAYMQGDYELSYNKNIPAAISFYTRALEKAQQLEDNRQIVFIQSKLGNAQLQQNNTGAAISHLLPAYTLSKAEQLTDQELELSKLLANSYYKQGSHQQAADFYAMANILADSIYNKAKTNELNFLEGKYQNQLKEKAITELTLTNSLNRIKILQRNKWLITGGAIAGVVLLLLFFLYKNSKQKQLLIQKDNEQQQQHILFLQQQQQVVSMQSMINGQETERTRIAKDLHDGLGGLFSTVKMHFSSLQHEQEALAQNAAFIKSYELVNTASEEVRRIAHNMMPEVLIKIGLIPAVQELCSSINAGRLLHTNLQVYGMDKRLNPSTEIMLYRIVQELLNNIIKHAHATEAILQFNKDGNRLSVTVEDNGRGFNTEAGDVQNGIGLESVKSRVTYLNGQLSIDSQQEVGTTVMMDFLIND
ncbi:tetratricopeptide repeat protein [Terrimonas rubra]|uniref:histidine kinase n=1 Tax=Terrimonas rubra TaxID=1035890 RepID=A0ABW6A8P0_9BACT